MSCNKALLGLYIEQIDRRNSMLEYGVEDVMGITNTKVLMETKARPEYADLSKFYILEPGEFIYNPRTSRNGEKVGMAYNDTNHNILFTFNNIPFRIKPESRDYLDPDYLYLFFLNPEFDRYARYNSWGSATELFPWEEMCRISIPVPPISEQRKIVHDYQVITDRIELLRKMNEKLEEQVSLHFESIFGCYIPDGLNVSDIIPDGWKVATVGDFCKANSATFSGKDDVLLYLDTGSITNNYISGLQTLNTNTDEIPSRARRKVSNGDIVYSTVRPNLRHYGLIFNPPENMIVSTGFAVMSMISNASVCSEIIYMWLTRNSVVNVLHSIAENSVSTYPSIVSADLEQIKMVVPSEDECTKIGAYYKSVFQTIDCNNREIRKLERLAVLFLNQLVKGA